ncbi:MAG: exo-alpha-sialidase [Chloroflexi bacterium]|nr:MAG: exo-alpha-sialidase [Chloroflexota bacterium]
MSHLKHIRVIAPLTVFLVILIAVASVGDGLARAASLVQVSSIDPYASCSITGQPGTNYPDAEVEPWVAVNPNNTSNIIGVWQQDRWSNGGARGLVAGVSTDGGSSWTQVPLPFSQCAGGLDFQRASDPWVSFGPDGTAYAVSISFDRTDNKNAVGAATSTDGGQTWNHLQTIVSYTSNGGQFITDKESVTADPGKAGNAYTVWDTLVAPTDNPDDNPHTRAFTGDAYFSKTTNGGTTWSTPKVIVHTTQNTQTIGNQVVVDPKTGTLYDYFDLILHPTNKPFNVAFVKSTDGGSTWTQPQIISKLGTVFVTDPNTGQAIRTGDIIPEPAIDPKTGQLYVVWQDARFNGGHFDEVALSTSTDGGANWSAPIQVNTKTPSNRPGFTPAIYVNSAGVVGVTYYDFRSLTTETATLPTDYWFRPVTPISGGLSLGSETHITGPFDMLTAPFASGFFVGDYEGLTAVGTTFHPFFVQANSGNTSNRTDVFTTSIP